MFNQEQCWYQPESSQYWSDSTFYFGNIYYNTRKN